MKANRKWLLILMLLLSLPLFTGFTANYITDENGKMHTIPLTYVADKVIRHLSEEAGYFAYPSDIFYAPNGLLYIADKGNHRIVCINCAGEVVRIFTNPDGGGLRNPQGVYVDADGDVYVADTDNARVVHLSPADGFVEEFLRPTSELYDSVYPFRPSKVIIDKIGQLYILNSEDYHGLIILDALGEFKGYVATTKLDFSLVNWIASYIATPEQQEKLAKRVPAVNTNFFIDSENTIYTVATMTDVAQLKRYSVAGINIYPKTDFFGQRQPDAMMEHLKKDFTKPKFTDVYVDANGIVTILDSVSGRMYQYDQSGHLLTIFGGTGNWAGRFSSAISLTGDAEGNLYVLDATQGAIHVFTPTQFIKKVHSTLKLYHEGRYEEAIGPWEEVLQLDKNYSIAHIGLGKAYLKQEKWVDSMREYKLAGDEEGYSQAFNGWRTAMLQQHFGLIVLGGIVLLVCMFYGIKRLRALYVKLNP